MEGEDIKNNKHIKVSYRVHRKVISVWREIVEQGRGSRVGKQGRPHLEGDTKELSEVWELASAFWAQRVNVQRP